MTQNDHANSNAVQSPSVVISSALYSIVYIVSGSLTQLCHDRVVGDYTHSPVSTEEGKRNVGSNPTGLTTRPVKTRAKLMNLGSLGPLVLLGPPMCRCDGIVNHVEERLWWPTQSPSKERDKKLNGQKEKQIRSSLLISDLKDGKCRIQERKMKARGSVNCMFWK